MFLLRRKRVDGGETTAPTFKAEVPDLAEPNLGDAAAEAAAIKIQTIWRGRDFRQLLFWLFSQVDVGYEIRLSTQRIKQRSLFYGLCKRLLFFASILTVVFMHQGGSVRRAEDRPPFYGFFASPEILEIPSDARVLVALGLSLLHAGVCFAR